MLSLNVVFLSTYQNNAKGAVLEMKKQMYNGV